MAVVWRDWGDDQHHAGGWSAVGVPDGRTVESNIHTHLGMFTASAWCSGVQEDRAAASAMVSVLAVSCRRSL
jgi:hypothetical protein